MSTGLLDLDHQIYDIILQLLALTPTIATKQLIKEKNHEYISSRRL